MAENYKKGIQRIFYRAKKFEAGKKVHMDILDPSLIWTTDLEFIEVSSVKEIGSGLYYLDFNFTLEGTYAALLYEDGIKLVSQNFFVSDNSGRELTFSDSRFKGPSVINNN